MPQVLIKNIYTAMTNEFRARVIIIDTHWLQFQAKVMANNQIKRIK